MKRDFETMYGKFQQLGEQTRSLQKDMKRSPSADLAIKLAVEVSLDLPSNPLSIQDFLNVVAILDMVMTWMDPFSQGKLNQIQKTMIDP